MEKCSKCGRSFMPETVRQKMVRQGRLRPDGANWHGQVAFFNMPRQARNEKPDNMTDKEEKQYYLEEFGIKVA